MPTSVSFSVLGNSTELKGDNTLSGDGIQTQLTDAEAAYALTNPEQLCAAAEALTDDDAAGPAGATKADPAASAGVGPAGPASGAGGSSVPAGPNRTQAAQPGRVLRELRTSLRDGTTVLLDTTTVRNALSALCPSSPPTAIELLDLNVLTVAAACFERVILQPDVKADDVAGTVEEDIHLPLQADRWLTTLDLNPAQLDDLDGLYQQAIDEVLEPSQASRWAADWAEFFNRRPNEVKLDFPDRFPARTREDYVWAKDYESKFWGGAPLADDQWNVSRYLAMQTCRTCFNDIVAGCVEVPYVSSALRAPIYATVSASKRDLLDVIGRLLPRLGASKQPQVETPQQTKVPFLLGRLLAKIQAPDEYWGEIIRLRRACEPVRALIAKQDEASADTLAAELQQCADSYFKRTDAAHAVVVFGVNVATANPAGAAAAVKLLAAAVSAPRVQQWLLKRRRPGLYPLFELATDTKSIKGLHSQVKDVWNKKLTPHTEQDLVRIGGYQAYRFQHPAKT